MNGIPSDLYNRLYRILSECGRFEDPERLLALFNIDKLSQWRNSLPEAKNKEARIHAYITFLYNKPYDEPNPLILFLNTLGEYAEGGCKEELASLAVKIADHLGENQDNFKMISNEELSRDSKIKSSEIIQYLAKCFNNYESSENLLSNVSFPIRYQPDFDIFTEKDALKYWEEVISKVLNQKTVLDDLLSVAAERCPELDAYLNTKQYGIKKGT